MARGFAGWRTQSCERLSPPLQSQQLLQTLDTPLGSEVEPLLHEERALRRIVMSAHRDDDRHTALVQFVFHGSEQLLANGRPQVWRGDTEIIDQRRRSSRVVHSRRD